MTTEEMIDDDEVTSGDDDDEDSIDDDDDDVDSNDEFVDTIVNVNFEAFPPDDSDFHGIRKLLQQVFFFFLDMTLKNDSYHTFHLYLSSFHF